MKPDKVELNIKGELSAYEQLAFKCQHCGEEYIEVGEHSCMFTDVSILAKKVIELEERLRKLEN